MKPLKFTVKKLYSIEEANGHFILGHNSSKVFINESAPPIAYQLTPEGDYSDYTDGDLIAVYRYKTITFVNILDNGKPILELSCKNPTQPFLVPAEHFNELKQAVHEYNTKYCQQEDMKVLDGFVEWVGTEHSSKLADWKTIKWYTKEYKATLSNPDKWFEMEGE